MTKGALNFSWDGMNAYQKNFKHMSNNWGKNIADIRSKELDILLLAGADQSVISPKLKRLREASEPYSWAHLAKGTNKQPGMVDVGRMPGTNW